MSYRIKTSFVIKYLFVNFFASTSFPLSSKICPIFNSTIHVNVFFIQEYLLKVTIVLINSYVCKKLNEYLENYNYNAFSILTSEKISCKLTPISMNKGCGYEYQ